ncbi:MAG: hypothetical protein IJ514_02100 [Clostridia bacterium]|nr:hypothetical protein [Clostridia bacterium]
MKKKLSAVVALGLAFGFVFSAGCSKDPETPPETPFDPADFTTAKTEDDIYTAVKYGVDEYGKYTGAMTVVMEGKGGSSETMGEDGGSYETESKSTVSWDPTTKALYMNQETKTTEKEGTTTTVSTRKQVGKYYKVGEQYYGYVKSTSKVGDADEQTQEQHYKITEAFLEQTIEQLKDTYADVEDVKEYLPDGEFTTLAGAYETVYSAQLQTQKTKDANAKATAAVTATNTEGVLETKIVTSTETTDEIEDGVSGLIKSDSESKIVAKDGKFSEAYTSFTVSASATVDGVACTMSESEASSVKITYSFDQAGFDSVTAASTDTAIDMPSSSGSGYVEAKFNVVVGDWTHEFDGGNSSTYPAQDAFNNYVGSHFSYSNAYTVTWYTDSACTTAVDWTDKKIDYLNDKTFYGKMTIEEGKAVVLKEITWADKRSDAYKIVFGEVSGNSYLSNVQGFTVNTDVANNKYEFEDREGFSEGLVIYVNGVAQADTATDFTYEANKMYVVNYCIEYTDTNSRFNVFKPY